MSQSTFTSRRALVTSVVTLTLARLVVNIPHRFAYPFLPEISRQLNVPLASVQSVMGIHNGIGITSPLFGPLSERFGRKRMLLGAIASMIGMSILGALLPQFWLFAAIMLALGLGKTIYDPAMQAYLGDRIPYKQRGRALGFTELSWAGSLIVAAPLAGFLLETATLQAVFWALAGLLAVSLVLVWVIVPADKPDSAHQIQVIWPMQAFGLLRRSPA
ncbi:MAG: MFS transporter, partial [Anaerolineae bacterium]|nr:MFS transporter [Anaerolineae bacterium]